LDKITGTQRNNKVLAYGVLMPFAALKKQMTWKYVSVNSTRKTEGA